MINTRQQYLSADEKEKIMAIFSSARRVYHNFFNRRDAATGIYYTTEYFTRMYLSIPAPTVKTAIALGVPTWWLFDRIDDHLHLHRRHRSLCKEAHLKFWRDWQRTRPDRKELWDRLVGNATRIKNGQDPFPYPTNP